MSAPNGGKIAVVGSGLIGRSWTMLFIGAGYDVYIYDLSADQLKAAKIDIEKQLAELQTKGLLRGTLTPAEQMSRISTTLELADCLKDAFYVQECVWESLDAKRSVFEKIDSYASATQILASSTSTIPGSKFSESMKHRNRFVVAHPVNPPFYCPLVELVPTQWTEKHVVDVTYDLMKKIGQSPVRLKKEIVGFALNRIQYAILAESYRLIADDVIDVDDLDCVMRDGLGARYAFLGPIEVTHLNAEGVEEYAHKYNKGYMNVCSTFGPTPSWEDEALLAKVKEQCESKVPLDKLAERRRWRDVRLAALAKLKKQLNDEEEALKKN